MMNTQLVADIVRLLKERHGMKDRGKWLREGTCPSCGEKGFYASAENPWRAYCGRLNNCAHEATAKDLFPELFEDWSTRFKQSDDNPHAAADAYLQNGRGFNLARLAGSYTQEVYRAIDSGQVTATVRFQIPGGSWWERFIDRAYRFGKMKARFAPGKSYMGEVWVPPTVTGEVLGTAEEIWIVEGIFDAVAVGHHGIVAVSAMSCNNYPKAFLERLRAARSGRLPTLVWALDGDAAGRDYTVRWVKKARADGFKCEAASIRQKSADKRDWNDLHLEGLMSADKVKEYRYQGSLLIARSAKERALLMYHHTKSTQFSVEFGNRLYWFEFNAALYQSALNEQNKKREDEDEASEEKRKEEALQLAAKIIDIANCNPEPLYFQKNLLTGEHWYYVRVTTHGGKSMKDTFRGDQLAAAGEFKKRLMSVVAGASFYGTTQQLDRHWGDDLLELKHVESIDFVGYSREHGAYLLGQVAVKAGNLIHINEEDFFELGRHTNVKSPTKSVNLVISQQPDSFNTAWVDKVWRCWGAGGMVALTFWFASLFAEQIRASQESFPFLELIGEPGSGKTTLIRFLWKLMGRAGYEGIDPSKSTMAARARAFVQVANLPVVLVEGDRKKDDASKGKKFDFNELKTAYNGGSIRALGVKSSGNETIEPPFRGAIVIEQNAPVDADRAVLERIVHLYFDKTGHRPETKAVAEDLSRMDMASLSYFVLKAAKAEATVMDIINERVPAYEKELLEGPVHDMRLAKNHAQLIAAFDALCEVLPVSDAARSGTQAFLRQMAAKREAALAADHPDVQLFWELYDYVNPQGGSEQVLNHSLNPDFIAISLPQFDAEMAARYMNRPTISDLKDHLKTSKARKFIDVKNVKSAKTGRATWCYVFKAPPKQAEPKE